MELLPTGSGDPVYNPDLVSGARGGSLNMANLRLFNGATVITDPAVPLGEVDVTRSESVCGTDGVVGRIQGLVIDPGSRRVTHIVLEEGHLWGR